MKKLFGLLTFILIGFINFGYCELIDYPYIEGSYLLTTASSSSRNKEIITNGNNVCVFGYGDGNGLLAAYDGNPIGGGSVIAGINYGEIYCSTSDFWIRNNSKNTITIFYGTKPIITSLDCQTEYNLIPVSSVDQNYCVNNGLCPSSDCPDNPSGTGDLQYSNIYINNILHPGKQNIFINIPDYIAWDYSQNEVDFNVYVGSGYDVDYINSIVDINSYRPTSDDFTNVFVSGLTLVFPYIFVALLILFIWKLLKRIFK